MTPTGATRRTTLSSPRCRRRCKGNAISPPVANASALSKKVFVTHGRNREPLIQLKELLTFGQFEPIVSVERESVSKPVPDKVLDDMALVWGRNHSRRCRRGGHDAGGRTNGDLEPERAN